ncbi:MAG: DNA alkylation repair protein [Muribaculaceae bacterium]|nr:DNA alkylation repair protein [Muribaculaceae bacterium]
MNNDEIIKSIKNDFRLGMNGIISTSMRNRGMDYKIIFGLSLPQLRTLAEKYSPSQEVAIRLWNENIRESKLLATMIFPHSEMSIDIAKEWIEDIKYSEVADIASMFLFSKLPYAEQLCLEYVNSENEDHLYFAFRLFIRLLINKSEISQETIETVKAKALEYSKSDNIFLALITNDIIDRFEN